MHRRVVNAISLSSISDWEVYFFIAPSVLPNIAKRLWNVCAILTERWKRIYDAFKWKSFEQQTMQKKNDSALNLTRFVPPFSWLRRRVDLSTIPFPLRREEFNLLDLNWRNSIFQQSASLASAQFQWSFSIAMASSLLTLSKVKKFPSHFSPSDRKGWWL